MKTERFRLELRTNVSRCCSQGMTTSPQAYRLRRLNLRLERIGPTRNPKKRDAKADSRLSAKCNQILRRVSTMCRLLLQAFRRNQRQPHSN